MNVPGKTSRVNAEKYRAMKTAFLKALPDERPGLTQKEMMAQVKNHLPENLFPGGATSGWRGNTVQFDLEAKGRVIRESCKPLRWYQA